MVSNNLFDSHCTFCQTFSLTEESASSPKKAPAATHINMMAAPAIPAAESFSPSRKKANTAVITGHSVCIRATDLSDILVSARFCIRYPRNVQVIARYRIIIQATPVVLSRCIPPSKAKQPPSASTAEHAA